MLTQASSDQGVPELAAVIGVPDARCAEIFEAFVAVEPAPRSPPNPMSSSRRGWPHTNIPARLELVEAPTLIATGKIIPKELRARG